MRCKWPYVPVLEQLLEGPTYLGGDWAEAKEQWNPFKALSPLDNVTVEVFTVLPRMCKLQSLRTEPVAEVGALN